MDGEKQQNMPCSTQETSGTKASAAKQLAAEEAKKEAERINRRCCNCCRRRQRACLTYFHQQTLVVQHFFEPMKIAKHEHVLLYDLPVQLKTDINIVVPENKKEPMVQLLVLITKHQMDSYTMVKLCPQSPVTVFYDQIRVRRNVFRCLSVAVKPPRSPVLYGEDLMIRLMDSDGPILYLSGAVPHPDNCGESKDKVPIVLTDTPGPYAKFSIVDPNPERMLALQGTPVPTSATGSIVICQTATNLLLAVELTEASATPFSVGHPVSCHTFRDPQNRITSENYRRVVTQAIDQGPGNTKNPDVSPGGEANKQLVSSSEPSSSQ